jgi:hypothetical protein
VLAAVPGQSGKGLTTASQNCTADSVPVYFMSSGSYQRMPEVPHYPDLFMRVDLLSRAQPLELGKTLTVQETEEGVQYSYELASESTFVLPGQRTIESDRTLHEWKASTAGDPVVRLRIESRAPTPDHLEQMFKVCWQVVLPRVDRNTCNVHDVVDGNFRGLEIEDDSAGTGPITWIGWF